MKKRRLQKISLKARKLRPPQEEADFLQFQPKRLSTRQQRVLGLLKHKQSELFRISEYYLGAIYALENPLNPDRHSQCAQSLRELMEKLPLVISVDEVLPNISGSNLKQLRDSIEIRLSRNKAQAGGQWLGFEISASMDKTLCKLEKYLQLNKKPSRSDESFRSTLKLDPLAEALGEKILRAKRERFYQLWSSLQGYAHHRTDRSIAEAEDLLHMCEEIILEALAPASTIDQRRLSKLININSPTDLQVNEAIGLITKTGANYIYFWTNLESASWLPDLLEKGFFSSPVDIENAGDGLIRTPTWHPLIYLERVVAYLPEKITNILVRLEPCDNPRVYDGILSIALKLDFENSIRLLPKMLEFAEIEQRFLTYRLHELIAHWANNGHALEALKLAEKLVPFRPDPMVKEKQLMRKRDAGDIFSLLEPATKIDRWEYEELLEKGIRPLADAAPLETVELLTKTLSEVIRMSKHPDDLKSEGREDYSEIWCGNLNQPKTDVLYTKSHLVQALVYACKQVFKRTPDTAHLLETLLRKQRWKIFDRIRHYLYGNYPSDLTLPWIQREITSKKDYGQTPLDRELQFMVREACEYFKEHLLESKQLEKTITSILAGPSKEDYRNWMGEHYSDEHFEIRKKNFHRNQLWAFEAILDQDSLHYLNSLRDELGGADPTPFEDPASRVRGGFISEKSPKSVTELLVMQDQQLLDFLNTWNDTHHDPDNWHVEYNHRGLMLGFKAACKEQILTNPERFRFWMDKRDEIELPLYVASIAQAMQDLLKEQYFQDLEAWFEFSKWVLDHPDEVDNQDEFQGAASWKEPLWGYARRAVGDFIDSCFGKEVEMPISQREAVFQPLALLCTHPDYWLDTHSEEWDEPLTTAINQTRSRALESLIDYGLWARRFDATTAIPEVFEIIEKRLKSDGVTAPDMTAPEYAILGVHLYRLCILDEAWVKQNLDLILPRDNLEVWKQTFASLLRYTHATYKAFEMLRAQYTFAVENISEFISTDNQDRELADTLAQHLFQFYIWDCYPLSGKDSLLELFYIQTEDERDRWKNLFNHVGHLLKNTGPEIDSAIRERIISFFDWRLSIGEERELRQFTFWLKAECMEATWRLASYRKVLVFGAPEDYGVHMEIETLSELVRDYPSEVVDCFAIITDHFDQQQNVYLQADEVKPILLAGLASAHDETKRNAARAQENLLRLGHFEYLDLD